MKNADNLITKILTNAEEKKAKILASAKEEKATILQTNEAKGLQESVEIIDKAKQVAVLKEERIISRAHLQARDNLLLEKQHSIKAVFERALAELEKMDEMAFQNYLTKAVKYASFTGEINLILGENPLADPHEFIAQLNSQLPDKKLVISDEKRAMTGFVLEQNRIELNGLFEAILQKMEKEATLEIAEKLFTSS